jgi:hypothetical protein
MKLTRLPRRWNPEEALKGNSKYHIFDARWFLYGAPYGDNGPMSELTEAWKKSSPIELDVYRTDTACQCGIPDCDACADTEADAEGEIYTDNTVIEIPEWENGDGLILNPSWYPAPSGLAEGKELGMDDYAKANFEFLCLAHLYWPHVHQYVERSHSALQAALEYLYDALDKAERDRPEESHEKLAALIEQVERACGE